MKCIGAAMVWVCLVMTGIKISFRLKQRLMFLEDITYMLNNFSSGLSYYRRPMTELINNYNNNEKNIDFINVCAHMLKLDVDFPDAWTHCVEKYCPHLKKHEKMKLIEYGRNIGKTDTDGQKILLDVYREDFSNYKIRAAEDFNKYSRTVIATFFFAGFGLFIILI